MEGWVDLEYPAMHRPAESNSRSLDHKSDALTTTPPSRGFMERTWSLTGGNGNGVNGIWKSASTEVDWTRSETPSSILQNVFTLTYNKCIIYCVHSINGTRFMSVLLRLKDSVKDLTYLTYTMSLPVVAYVSHRPVVLPALSYASASIF